MRKVFILLIIFLGLGGFIVYRLFYTPHTVLPKNKLLLSPTPAPVAISHTAIFVPYWTLDGKIITANYNPVVYFGITANTFGIDTKEDGYKDIAKFTQSVHPNQKTLLTVRLLDPTINEKLLHDKVFQKEVIQQALVIAQKNHFDGIVLDLEYKALAFDEVVKSVSDFSSSFATSTHTNHLLFYETLYGDTLYRLRPYDVATIGKVSDGIFILAYDFHKANGNPGPNFPLNPLPDEAYSFSKMIDDFMQKIPANKIIVVFGLFGYDWTINDKNQSVGQASTITASEAQQKFFPTCQLPNCLVKHDPVSAETKVTYKDTSSFHEVWLETMQSVMQKEALLTTKGISSVALWAYSYF